MIGKKYDFFNCQENLNGYLNDDNKSFEFTENIC